MKFKFGSFLAGILCAALIGGLTVSALAITGKTTIEVYPINVMVNGEVFQPTDAHGNPVDIFTYNGTTYAPLRALATAYGLEVGYDAEKKLATVTDPALKKPEAPATPDYSDWSAEEEAAYQEFKGMWEVTKAEKDLSKTQSFVEVTYTGEWGVDEVTQILKDNPNMMERYMNELNTDNTPAIYLHFYVADKCVDSIASVFGILSTSNS